MDCIGKPWGWREAALVDHAAVVLGDGLEHVALDAADGVRPGDGDGAVDRRLARDAVDGPAPLGADVERPAERLRARCVDWLEEQGVAVGCRAVGQGDQLVLHLAAVAGEQLLVAAAEPQVH